MKGILALCVIVGAAAIALPAPARPTPIDHPIADADTGYLDVTSDPPAKVVVDGADLGVTTPAKHIPLKAGHHKLQLATPDGHRKRTIGFIVDPGQTTKLNIILTS